MREGIRKSAILRRDAELLAELERSFSATASIAGEQLQCGAGCADCCHGPFPITPLDVSRLERGLEELGRRDPARARSVRQRAGRAVAVLVPGFPGDVAAGRLNPDVKRLDSYFERHASLPCPALDPASGRCDLYAARPVSCRTYGPPIDFGGETAPPCPLCFRGATARTVERCRMRPDPDGLEAALLHDLGVDAGGEWATLIAFALAGARP